jgi:DNA-directed RNA polymerase specialized sigma24 family protein
LESILEDLNQSERFLIRQLFWEGRSEEELALELGVSRQAINLRKQKVLQQLGSELRIAARGTS